MSKDSQPTVPVPPPSYGDLYYNDKDKDKDKDNGYKDSNNYESNKVYIDLESGEQTVIYDEGQPTMVLINSRNDRNGNGSKSGKVSIKKVGQKIYIKFMEDRTDNNLFVIKVLTTVCLQLIFTTFVGALAYNNTPFKTFLIYAYLPSIAMMLVTIIALSCCGLYNKFPINYILFTVFTASVSFMIGLVVTFYEEQTLILAVSLTLIIFLSITVYLVITKKDFDFLFPALISFTLLLIFLPIIFLVFPPSDNIRILWYTLGVIIFIGWLLVDISRLVNGKYQDMFGEKYAWLMAAIDIYMDMINLFLYILQLLGGGGGNRGSSD